MTIFILNINFLETFAQVSEIIGVLLAITGIIFAYKEYKKNQLVKRAEFYTKLFETLFKDTVYQRIRELLDPYEYNDDYYLKLNAELKNDSNGLQAEMTNYLNFLEYVMVLHKIKVIDHDDIINLLDYYLTCLSKNKVAMKYIKEFGFKNLLEKIIELKHCEID
jgi:hypothetical protein